MEDKDSSLLYLDGNSMVKREYEQNDIVLKNVDKRRIVESDIPIEALYNEEIERIKSVEKQNSL